MMSSQKNLDVRKVKSCLVATFNKANPPLVWRIDLDKNHSFTVAMQDEDQEWILGMTSPDGGFHSIARFQIRKDAEDALASIGGILSQSRFYWVLPALKIMGFTLLALLVLEWCWTWLSRPHIPQHVPPYPPVAMTPPIMPPMPMTPPTPPTPPPASLQHGIPLPADEVLQPPSP